MMSTRAVHELHKAGIDHVLHPYAVDESVGDGYGEAVAAAIGIDPARVFKTLLAKVDADYVVAIVPVMERLSMKKLASAAGGRKADMAATGDAERITGYVSGGISPLGQRRRLRTFLDKSAGEYQQICVSAGKRGLQVELPVMALVELVGGEMADLIEMSSVLPGQSTR
ncbi:MAG TPA: Cys-tRNA(Pro) deacylase [Acidimicrobiia bacterium]